MQTVQPSPPRYQIKDLGDTLRILPAPAFKKNLRPWHGIVLIILWGFETSSTIFITVVSLSTYPNCLTLFLPWFMWLLFSVFFGLFIAFMLSFQETLLVSAEAIVIKYQTVFYKQAKRYLAAHIADWRAAASYERFGTLAFDYGGQTIGCGVGLSEAEAKQIIRAIQQKFPQYQNQP